MANKDLFNNVSVAIAIPSATYTANKQGTAVDTQGYNSVLFVVQTGTVTDGEHTFSLMESDDNQTFTTVDPSDLLGTLPAVDDTMNNKAFKFGYLGMKRYLRVDVVVTGETTGGVYGVGAILGDPRVLPAP